MKTVTRRDGLATMTATLATAVSGCQSFSEKSSTTTSDTQETPPSGGGGGGRPPWDKQGSDADVVIANESDESVTVQVETVGFQTSVTLDLKENWISENLIPDGRSTRVTVKTNDGLERTADWEAESGNDKYFEFAVHPDEILVRKSYKGTKTR